MTESRGPRLELTREQVLARRRSVSGLDARSSSGSASLRRAAWPGLQDSMPRAAVLSIHARIEGTRPATWEDASLVQVWGPRFSAYVVAERDVAAFTLGRLPDDPVRRRFAQELAGRLAAFLDGQTMPYSEAGRGLGEPPNRLRYAAVTGTVRIHWDGARQPTVWSVPSPDISASDARLDLAQRYLTVFGPTTVAAFATWAGIGPRDAKAAFDGLAGSLTRVRTPVGEGWILSRDASDFVGRDDVPTATRLLPSGDAYFLLQGADRTLLVPDADRQGALWTPRVWPGAVLVGGEIAGTWRRSLADVTVTPWRHLTRAERVGIEEEAAGLPLPDIGAIRVRWAD